MSEINRIIIPVEEGSQLPISDSLTSPDSGVTASSKAAYLLNNKIEDTITELQENITTSIDNIQTEIDDTINTQIAAIKASISNVDNTRDYDKNVNSARVLTSARTIGGVSFNGSANINLPGVNITGNQNTTGNAATATTTTGNAGSATKLETPITIGGVSFDGTSNISLPGVNTIGNQGTTGNAATATYATTAGTAGSATYAAAWSTARSITINSIYAANSGQSSSASMNGTNNVTLYSYYYCACDCQCSSN